MISWIFELKHGVPSPGRIQAHIIFQRSTVWARYEWESIHGYSDSCIFTRDEACDANKPALFRHHDETDLSPYVDVHFYIDDIGEYGSFFSPMQFIRHLEASMHPIVDSDDEADDVIKCSNKVAKMSLQCEACGPDLEKHQRRKRKGGTRAQLSVLNRFWPKFW